jgi:hypothetical protein
MNTYTTNIFKDIYGAWIARSTIMISKRYTAVIITSQRKANCPVISDGSMIYCEGTPAMKVSPLGRLDTHYYDNRKRRLNKRMIEKHHAAALSSANHYMPAIRKMYAPN